MKRADVNRYLQYTRDFFTRQDVPLPSWADYGLRQWRQQQEDITEIVALRLGWDLTSFGGDDFLQTGLTLFTLRNGSPHGTPWHKPYAEKVMHVREGQVTPMHYHPRKMEDIINRGGGNLIVELYNREGHDKAATPVTVSWTASGKPMRRVRRSGFPLVKVSRSSRASGTASGAKTALVTCWWGKSPCPTMMTTTTSS